jgi:hypothetical protein
LVSAIAIYLLAGYFLGGIRPGPSGAACCYEEAIARKRKAELKAHAAQVIDALEAIRLRRPG